MTSVYNRIAQLNNIATVAPDNLIGYWRCSDPPGSTIMADASGENNVGTWHNTTLGEDGVGDTRTSVLFNGTTSYGDVLSSSLLADFDGDEGTLLAFLKVDDQGTWTDGLGRKAITLQVNTNNRVQFGQSATPNQLSVRHQGVGGTATGTIGVPADQTDWFCLAMTWSKSGNVVHAYIDGVLSGTFNGVGTFTGDLTLAALATTTIPATVGWSGWMAHVALYDTPLTADQIALIAIPDADPVATTPVTQTHTTAPLVTLAEVRAELNLEETTQDQRLIRFIAQAHSAIVLKLRFDYPRDVQTRWVNTASDPRLTMPGGGAAAVYQVVEDGTELDSSAYELDPDDGRSLLRLDTNGRPQRWIAGDRMVQVTYLPVRPPQALIGAELSEVIRLFHDYQGGYADRVGTDGTTVIRYSHKLSRDTLDIIDSLQNRESVGIY